MYWSILNYPGSDKYNLQKIASTLRLCISGGAPMSAEVMRAFEEKFKVSILEGYGLLETSPIATFNRLDRPSKPGSVGLPMWGVWVRIVDRMKDMIIRGGFNYRLNVIKFPAEVGFGHGRSVRDYNRLI